MFGYMSPINEVAMWQRDRSVTVLTDLTLSAAQHTTLHALSMSSINKRQLENSSIELSTKFIIPVPLNREF